MLIQVIAVEYLRYLQFDRNFKDIAKRRRQIGMLVMFWLHREIESLKYSDVSSFIADLHKRKCKPTYINTLLSVLRAFLKFCQKSDVVVMNFKEVEFVSVPRKTVNYLTPVEVRSFFKLLEGDTLSKFRDRAIFSALFDTGMRISECLSLKVSQLKEILEGECTIIGKGGHERKVFFTWARGYIEQYVSLKPSKDDSEFLFTNYCNGLKYRFKPLRPEPFRKRLRTLRAKFGKYFTTHDTRRTAATNWKEKGMDIYDVSKILGHQSVKTTEHYYLGVDWKRLRRVHEKYSDY